MIISHTFEAGTSIEDKRDLLYNKAFKHLFVKIVGMEEPDQDSFLLFSLINLRLKGAKCSIEFTEEYKNIKDS